jgi:hypothetical protein
MNDSWERLPALVDAQVYTKAWLLERHVTDPPAFLVHMTMEEETRQLIAVLSIVDLIEWATTMTPRRSLCIPATMNAGPRCSRCCDREAQPMHCSESRALLHCADLA